MHCSEAMFASLRIYLLGVFKSSFFAVCRCVVFLSLREVERLTSVISQVLNSLRRFLIL